MVFPSLTYCCTLPVYSVFILMQAFVWALSFVRLKHLLCIQDVHCCCLPQTFTMWHLWCQICGSSQFLGPVWGCSSCLCVGCNLYSVLYMLHFCNPHTHQQPVWGLTLPANNIVCILELHNINKTSSWKVFVEINPSVLSFGFWTSSLCLQF